MNVMLTSKENYDKIMEWFYVQPKDVTRDFPIPNELIVPVEGLPKAQIEELLSDNPEEYRINHAKEINEFYYISLYCNKPSRFDKEWYVALNPYDAQFFDAEMYAEELREVTDDNGWRFDKVDNYHSGYGKIYCFIKDGKQK